MFSEDYWFPVYPIHFRRDTMHLTPAQEGIYWRLIFHYMETKKPIPSGDIALARIIGVPIAEHKQDLSTALAFFKKDEAGNYLHKRCQKIIQEQTERTEKRAARAKAGGIAKAKKMSENNAKPATSTAQEVLKPATIQNITKQDSKKDNTNVLSPTTTKGTRLPRDWVLPEDFLNWGLENTKLSRVVLLKQADKFRDYWIARSGAGGVKADWAATWRNWIRKTEETQNESNRYNGSNPRELSGHAALGALHAAASRVVAEQELQGSVAAIPADDEPIGF